MATGETDTTATIPPEALQEAAEFLTKLDAGFPDLSQYDGATIRAIIKERGAAPTRQPDMLRVTDLDIDGPGGPLPIRIFEPHAATDQNACPVILFAHGGGFVFCDLDTHDGLCRMLAEGVGAVVVSVDYRLAPEHQAPAAHDDFYAALQWTAANIGDYHGDSSRIILAGDSAGGNLAATVSITARDAGGPPVAGQVLLYAVIDDDFETEAYRKFGVGHYNTTSNMKWYWDNYAPDGRDDPRLIPTRAESLAGLPPAVVITAELDPPSDAGDAYARALQDAGVDVRHRRYDGLFHGFLTFPALSAVQIARAEILEMIRSLAR